MTGARRVLALLGRHRLAEASIGVLCLLVTASAMASAVGEWVVGVPYHAVDLDHPNLPPDPLGNMVPHPGAEGLVWHPLGTNGIGQDVLVRLLYGGRVSLLAGASAALLGLVLGVLVGGIAGLLRGRADAGLMRFTDAMMALPTLPVLLILSGADLRNVPGGRFLLASGLSPAMLSVVRIVLLESVFAWMGTARLVRGQILTLRERDFAMASRALGAGPLRILLRHLLPNCAGPILVAGTLAVGEVILAESALSFLGLGVQPPLPSWGNLLFRTREYLRTAPWLAIYPGVCILLTVASFNFLGDGLRDALDPRTREDAR